MARLFVELLKDSLNEYAYNAEIAGVDYKIENTMYGICVSIEKSALVKRFVFRSVSVVNQRNSEEMRVVSNM